MARRPAAPPCALNGGSKEKQASGPNRPGQGGLKHSKRPAPFCLLHPPAPPKREAPKRMTPEQRAFAVRHLGLAHQQARRFALRHGMEFEDVVGAAYLGLCKAALGFDQSRGFRPSSYVVPKVKGELLHHLRDTGFALRIPHRYRELWVKARRLVALGLEDQQIADVLGVPVEVWLDVQLACGVAPVPLSKRLRNEQVQELGGGVEDEAPRA